MIESANNLFREYEDSVKEGGIISAVSSGLEFQQILKGEKSESGLGKLESRIFALGQSIPPLAVCYLPRTGKNWKTWTVVFAERLWHFCGHILVVWNLMILRSTKQSSRLLQLLMLLIPLTSISLAFGTTAPILASYLTAQNLMQALPPGASPLLQLPHFTPVIAKAIEGDSKTHMTLQQYMRLPEQYRYKISVGKGLLTDPQYRTAMDVAKQLPYLQVEKAFFKVTGERFITPAHSSL